MFIRNFPVRLTAFATAAMLAVCIALGSTPLHAADAVITNCATDTALRNAVTSAGTGTITFNCGAKTIPMTSFIAVPNGSNYTIDGGNAIVLDGVNASAFFQVSTGAHLTVRHLSFIRGAFAGAHPLENFGTLTLLDVGIGTSNTGANGGVVWNSNVLDVTNVSFTDNVAASQLLTAMGTAILQEGGASTIRNTSFVNNQLSGTFGIGGAVAIQAGTSTILDSLFDRNRGADGGALSVNAGTQVTVTHSTFTGNIARYGGAIESTGELQVDFSTFVSNTATAGEGGAIWVLGSDTDVTYSAFDGNTAAIHGGGISCNGNFLSIIHSTLSNNRAGILGSALNGGGIYSTCNLNLTNSTLSGNKAPNGGGGALYQTNAGSANVVMVTFANNTALFGAGVYNDGAGSSSLFLQQSMLVNNKTGNCDGVITSFGNNVADDNNCAALTQPGDLKLANLPLAPLADNGGPTRTHLPLPGSAALNHTPAADCAFTIDQRDARRPVAGLCDAGAVEAAMIYLPSIRQ